jgi:hypothetical protein
MAALKLSTGIEMQSDQIQHVEYYPGGSLWMSCGFTALADQHFLYIRTATGTIRLAGRGAAQDADTIERAGVRVYRRCMPRVLRESYSPEAAVEQNSTLKLRVRRRDRAQRSESSL